MARGIKQTLPARKISPGNGLSAGMVLRGVSVLALLAYPFAIYFGLERFGPTVLAVTLGLLLTIRLATGGYLKAPGHAAALLLAVAVFIAASLYTGDARVLKAYPVLINLGLFVLFALSLAYPPTLPERGMRLAGREVPSEAHNYLRGVTVAWCGFFIGNGLVAAWTALYASIAWWTLYNGLISYLLIGLFFAGEYLLRMRVKRQHARQAKTDD